MGKGVIPQRVGTILTLIIAYQSNTSKQFKTLDPHCAGQGFFICFQSIIDLLMHIVGLCTIFLKSISGRYLKYIVLVTDINIHIFIDVGQPLIVT